MISGINDATGAAIPTDLIVQLFVPSYRIQCLPELRDSADYYRLHRARHWFPLAQGAGKMLGITVVWRYISSILAGFLALTCALLLYPIILKGVSSSLPFDNPENALSRGLHLLRADPDYGRAERT